MTHYLKIEFAYLKGGIFMSQSNYILKMLEQFKLTYCNPGSVPMHEGTKLSADMNTEKADSTLYRQMVGKLLYLTNTRPDISYSVEVASRFMNKPQKAHLDAVKQIMRYLKHTAKMGIMFKAR